MFPWSQSSLLVVFHCEYCDRELRQSGNFLEQCACQKSRENLAKERERLSQFNQSRRPSFAEAQKRNKFFIEKK